MTIKPTTPLDNEINQALGEFQANITKGLYVDQPLQHIVDDLNIQRLMITRISADLDHIVDVLNDFDSKLKVITQILEENSKKEGFWSKFKGLFR